MAERPLVVFDKRIVNQNLKRGLFTHKELASYLERLPDSKEKAQPLFGKDELERRKNENGSRR